MSSAKDTAVLADAKLLDRALMAKTTDVDISPAAAVAAGLASASGLAAYLSMGTPSVTVTANSASAPTQLQVVAGSRTACVTLGTAPGQASTITAGVCSATFGAAPVAPALTAAVTAGAVTASWTATPGATSYTVARTVTTVTASAYGALADRHRRRFGRDQLRV